MSDPARVSDAAAGAPRNRAPTRQLFPLKVTICAWCGTRSIAGIWDELDVRSCGMPFSQEIKNEAFVKGFRCAEVGIEYRVRGGEVKLSATRDGVRNLSQLLGHRLRARRAQANSEPVASVGVNGKTWHGDPAATPRTGVGRPLRRLP